MTYCLIIYKRPSLTMKKVIATSFADPKDVDRYNKVLAETGSEKAALQAGDNGVGAWGDITATEEEAICALPPEVIKEKWGSLKQAKRKPVAVKYADVVVTGVLGDIMPSVKSIKNGAGIDLNPGFAIRLGLKPPFKTDVEWEWGDGG